MHTTPLKKYFRLMLLLALSSLAACADVREKVLEINILSSQITATMEVETNVQKLLEFTSDENPIVRTNAFAAIKRTAPKIADQYIPPIFSHLSAGLVDREQSVRREAAAAIGAFGVRAQPFTAPLLSAIKNEPDSDVAMFAVQSLGKINAEGITVVPVLTSIVSAAKDVKGALPLETISAVRCLTNFNGQSGEIIKALRSCLSSTNPEYLGALAETLASLDGNADYLEPTLSKLSDGKNVRYKISSLRSIDRLQSWPSSIRNIVVRLSNDTDATVKEVATAMLNDQKHR